MSPSDILDMTTKEIVEFFDIKNEQEINLYKNMTLFLAPAMRGAHMTKPNELQKYLQKLQNLNNHTEEIEYNDKELSHLKDQFKDI